MRRGSVTRDTVGGYSCAYGGGSGCSERANRNSQVHTCAQAQRFRRTTFYMLTNGVARKLPTVIRHNTQVSYWPSRRRTQYTRTQFIQIIQCPIDGTSSKPAPITLSTPSTNSLVLGCRIASYGATHPLRLSTKGL